MKTNIINQSLETQPIDYDKIAESYDFISNLFSIGLIGAWRNNVSYFLSNYGPLRILDLGSGSGGQIFSFFQTDLEIISVNGIDSSQNMVEIAQKKILKKNLNNCVFIEKGNAVSLRFSNNFFDAVTISFSLRDIERKDLLFKEVHRVLKGDCSFIILDIPNPSDNRFSYIFSLYLKYIYSNAGGFYSGFPNIYHLLWRRLPLFPNSETLCKELKVAGFQKVNTLSLSAGAAMIVSAKKRVY
jgi:demethylmenaquinone methyltransferase / 2-methoxy-6-polyprenyl-1,4-benzoquinol methylase